MDIPEELRQAIDRQVYGVKQSQIVQAAQNISACYRSQRGPGEHLLSDKDEALAYAVSRMPATYGAVFSSLKQAIDSSGYRPATLIDAGAGTGAASWAANSLLNLTRITCLEREETMLRLGKTLMAGGPGRLDQAEWVMMDIHGRELPVEADLVISSYMLNEMTDEQQIGAAVRFFRAAREMLLFVEPGTPKGYAILQRVRNKLLESGAHVIAPCLQEGQCPMRGDDWCHFSCRIPRSRLHRQAKGGEVPYEDEKYAYLAIARNACQYASARILRHPLIRKGHLELEVCTKDGIRKITLSKKDGERYRQAQKAKIGDII